MQILAKIIVAIAAFALILAPINAREELADYTLPCIHQAEIGDYVYVGAKINNKGSVELVKLMEDNNPEFAETVLMTVKTWVFVERFHDTFVVIPIKVVPFK